MIGLPLLLGQPLYQIRQPCYRNSHQHTKGAVAACKEDSGGNKYVTDALLEYMWRRRFRETSGTSQIMKTFNAVCVCLKRVYGN